MLKSFDSNVLFNLQENIQSSRDYQNFKTSNDKELTDNQLRYGTNGQDNYGQANSNRDEVKNNLMRFNTHKVIKNDKLIKSINENIRTKTKFKSNIDKHPLENSNRREKNFKELSEELRNFLVFTSEQMKSMAGNFQRTPYQAPAIKYVSPFQSKNIKDERSLKINILTEEENKLIAQNIMSPILPTVYDQSKEVLTSNKSCPLDSSSPLKKENKLILPLLDNLILQTPTKKIDDHVGQNIFPATTSNIKRGKRIRDISKFSFVNRRKFLTYAYCVYFHVVLCSQIKQRRYKKKLEILDYFTNDYAGECKRLTNWLKSSLKLVISSITRFPDMNLVMIRGDSHKTNKEKFLKIQIRLNSILEQLNSILGNLKKIGNLSQHLTSRDVPMRIFSLFELSRLRTNRRELMQLSEEQKLMIVSFYFFIKILIKEILMTEISRTCNRTVINNIRFVSSVIYYSLTNYFRSHLPIINNKTMDYMVCSQISWDDKVYDTGRIQDGEYKDKCKEQNMRHYQNNKLLCDLYLKANNTIAAYENDRDKNDINEIVKILYSYEDVSEFFMYSEKNNFDLMNQVKRFCINLMD